MLACAFVIKLGEVDEKAFVKGKDEPDLKGKGKLQERVGRVGTGVGGGAAEKRMNLGEKVGRKNFVRTEA